MDYSELIVKALNGRNVSEAARAWGVNQPTLDRWIKGQGMPNYRTALRMAREAKIDPAEAFEVLAEHEQVRESKSFKLQSGIVQIQLVALLAATSLCYLFYIM